MKLERRPFDSKHYEIEVGTLVPETGDDRSTLEAELARARARGFSVMFLRLDLADPLCALVEAAGYRCVDRLVTSTLQRDAKVPESSAEVELAHHPQLVRDTDIEAVVAITSSIRSSHLHADPRLPLDRTIALYEAWARNDVTGRAAETILARSGGEVAGYITLLEAPGRIVLDLVAVRSDLLGKGIGSAMLASMRRSVESQDAIVTVGTQHDNPALALYARFGFCPTATHLTYHLWLDER